MNLILAACAVDGSTGDWTSLRFLVNWHGGPADDVWEMPLSAFGNTPQECLASADAALVDSYAHFKFLGVPRSAFGCRALLKVVYVNWREFDGAWLGEPDAADLANARKRYLRHVADSFEVVVPLISDKEFAEAAGRYPAFPAGWVHPTDARARSARPDSFAALPDEVLVLVLRQLPLDSLLRCGALARRWLSVLRRTPSLFCRLSLDGVTARGELDNASLSALCARSAGGLISLDLSSDNAALCKRVAPTGLVEALAGSGCLELRLLDSAKPFSFSVAQAARLLADCPTLQGGSLELLITASNAHLVPALLPAGFTISLRACKYRSTPDNPSSLPNMIDALATAGGGGVVALHLQHLGAHGELPTGHALSRLLDASSVLRSLSLSVRVQPFNPPGLVGGLALMRSLETNETLTALDVFNTYLGTAEVVALGAVLRLNSTLRQLNLSKMDLSAAGCAALAAGLAANSTLTELKLRSAKLGPRGVCAIAAALRHPTTALRKLALAFNGGGLAGAEALLATLARNTTLTRVSYLNNGLRLGDLLRLKRAPNAERVKWR